MTIWGVRRVQWLYRLPQNFSWQSPFLFDRDWAFQDKEGHTRLIISASGLITVTAGYAWDGCTPKFSLLDFVHFGTPDGVLDATTGQPKTYYASLIHDALYQFLPDALPLNRKETDDCFLMLMTETGFMPRYVYYLAVRALGWATLPIMRHIRRTYGGHRLDLQEYVSDAQRRQPNKSL